MHEFWVVILMSIVYLIAFSKFNQLMYSLDERENFLSQSEVYKLESAGKDEEQQRVILNKLVRENITITKPDEKKDSKALWGYK